MSLTAPLATLQRISSAATSGAHRYRFSSPSRAYPSGRPAQTALSLPIPPSVSDKLLALGLDVHSVNCIASVVLRIVLTFKHNLEADHKRRSLSFQSQAECLQDAKFNTLISSTYRTVYAKAIRHWSSYVVEDFTPRLLRARALHRECLDNAASGNPQRKRPFNTNALPILERFFERSAFPSRLEKFDLASQCDMEYRQIHVWFQNRRSRCRKEGKKLNQPDRQDALVEALDKSVADTLLPMASDSQLEDDIADETLIFAPSHTVKAVLPTWDLDAPPHAFPSCYPPLCAYDPFPISSAGRNLQHPWARRADTRSPPRQAWSVSQLTEAFANLTIREAQSAPPPPSSVVQNTSDLRSANTPLGFVTPCSRAPHPAMIRRFKRPLRLPTCPASAQHHSFAAPARFDVPVRPVRPVNRSTFVMQEKETPTSISTAALERLPQSARRCKRALPRRVPKNPPVPSYAAPASPAEPTSPRTPRMASAGSVTSADSSPRGSPLRTPPSYPHKLPMDLAPFHTYNPEYGIQPLLEFPSPSSLLMEFFQPSDAPKEAEAVSVCDVVVGSFD